MRPSDPNYGELVDWIRVQCANLALVDAVVLCGSRARGTQDPVSDIDLLVVIQGSSKYLQWGTWQGIATEVIYVPQAMLDQVRPGLLTGRKILWRSDNFDVNQLPNPIEAPTTGKELVGYTAWDLRQTLRILGHQLRCDDIEAFWYGAGLWIPLAVRYVLETQPVAIPTLRRQWSLLESIAPEVAARFAALYRLKDPQRVYDEMLEIVDDHLKVPLPPPIQGAPVIRLDPDGGSSSFTVRRLNAHETSLIGEYWEKHWGAAEVVSRDIRHLPDTVAGWVAEDPGGAVLGLLTVREQAEWELVSLDSDQPGRGIGSTLLHQVEGSARQNGVHRLWLITSNDNLDALGFYQRRGWDLVAVHRGAIDRARRIKPAIPVTGLFGIPLHHEIELEKMLD